MSAMGNEQPFFENEVRFTVEAKELVGILTQPATTAHHPAVVLLHGADRSGVADPYYQKHAHHLVQSGYAVLRNNGPGWGGDASEGDGFETLEYRRAEVIAAVSYLQSRPDI